MPPWTPSSGAYADAGQYADAVKWAENSVEVAPEKPARPDDLIKDSFRQRIKSYKGKH